MALLIKTQTRNKKRTPDRLAFNILGGIFVTAFAISCILPFYMVIIASFTSEAEVMELGYRLWPQEWSLESYMLSLKNPTIVLRAYANTIGVTLVGTVLSTFLITMTGYVLQRKDFVWRNKFTFFFFFTTLFSGGLVPWYLLVTQYLGFINKYYALILPLLFPVWNMIIAKNFMRSIPHEITESAIVDGASDIKIFLKIILPLSLPLLATIGLFTALAYWNDWYNCMLFMKEKELWTLQYLLQKMIRDAEQLKWVAAESGMEIPYVPINAMKMSLTVIVTGPIILVYPFVQKYFVKGLTIGAVKG